MQRSSLDKDKKLAALKVQVKEMKDEAQEKEKESAKEAKAPQRPRDVSPRPRPYLTPPSVSQHTPPSCTIVHGLWPDF